MRLQNKVALVTGAASGFGKAIAETYAREGAKVAIVDINAGAAQAVAKAIGPAAIAVGCDVARRADVDAAAAATVKAFGTIDILVNNAGTTHRNRPMLEVDEAEFDRVFAVNVKSIFLFAHAVIPMFRRQGKGVIINIGSTAGIRPRPGLAWYNATKGAVNLLDRRSCGAREVRRLGAARPALAAAGRGQRRVVPRLRGGGIPHRRGA